MPFLPAPSLCLTRREWQLLQMLRGGPIDLMRQECTGEARFGSDNGIAYVHGPRKSISSWNELPRSVFQISCQSSISAPDYLQTSDLFIFFDATRRAADQAESVPINEHRFIEINSVSRAVRTVSSQAVTCSMFPVSVTALGEALLANSTGFCALRRSLPESRIFAEDEP